MDLEALLADRLRPAFAAVAGRPVDPAVRRSPYADFQSGAALGLARELGRPPRDLAAAAVEQADLDDLCASVEVSGPGFVNLVVADRALGPLLDAMAADDRLGVAPAAVPETVVVDYSAPNVAKEMHVGHLRSTIIGDALARILTARGHHVVRANHLGDWGTPFGMLIEHLADDDEPADLGAFYRAARAAFDASAEFRERSRRRVVALQSGDPETLRRWRSLVDLSQRYFLAVYDRLGVTLTAADFRPESSYNDRLPSIVDDLAAAGLLRDSEGAQCAFPAGFTGRDGQPLPLIVRKSDGGYGYAATDLAAVRHRTEHGATRLLYVVGQEQRHHFAMVFAVAREAGWLAPPARAEHVDHGLMLGPDGRKLASRTGDSLKLGELLDDAVARAAELAAAKNPDLDDATVHAVAEAVGIGAVKYADLSTDRAKDYVFSLDRLLALDGDTAPYLQYAHARIRSLLRKAGPAADPAGRADHKADPAAPIVVDHPAEHALALELLAFAPTVVEVEATLEPHRLAGRLHGVATAFSRFFESCPVLRSEPDVRASRLALSGLTARVLSRGLDLLGIQTPDRL